MAGLEDVSWQERVARLAEIERTGANDAHEVNRLMHDLHVHQIELEMQNRELREAHDALEASRARYAELYDRAPVGYATFDGTGCIVEINLTAAHMLGRERDQLISVPFRALELADQAVFHAHLQRAADAGGSITDDVALRTRGRDLVVQLTTIARSPTEDGTAGFRTILADVTDLRRTERRAAEAEREQQGREAADSSNRMKDVFLGIVSHELRTPLSALLGWIQILASGSADAARVAHGADVMRRNGQALARMVDDLLDVSRVIGGKLRIERELVDVARIVRAAVEAMRPVAVARRIEMSEAIEDAGCKVLGDATRLQQAVSNLLSNALKFTPERGHVWVSLAPGRRRARLEVRDDGVGIDAAEIPLIFDHFHQADPTARRSFGGLGLGLAIARSLIEAQGGTIEAHSAGRGQGASVVVELPLALAQATTSEVPPARLGPHVTDDATLLGVKVLFVDDDLDMLELVQMTLGCSGAVVRTAASADEAIGVLAGFVPDVLVSDIAMPARDGYDLIREIRGMAPPISRVPVIAMTAHARLDEAIRAHFVRHLAKPVDASVLARAIHDVVFEGHDGVAPQASTAQA